MMYAAAAAMNVAGYAPGHPLLGPWGGHHQCGAMEQGQRLPAWALSRVKPAVCMPQGREDGARLRCTHPLHQTPCSRRVERPPAPLGPNDIIGRCMMMNNERKLSSRREFCCRLDGRHKWVAFTLSLYRVRSRSTRKGRNEKLFIIKGRATRYRRKVFERGIGEK